MRCAFLVLRFFYLSFLCPALIDYWPKTLTNPHFACLPVVQIGNA